MKLAVLKRPNDFLSVNAWVSENCTNPVILISSLDDVTKQHLIPTFPCFTQADIYGPHSDVVDNIYRDVFHFKQKLHELFKEYKVFGVAWIEDLFGATSVHLHGFWTTNKAVQQLFKQGYDEVILITETIPFYFDAILDEAKDSNIEVIGNSILEFHPEQGWVASKLLKYEPPEELRIWAKSELAKITKTKRPSLLHSLKSKFDTPYAKSDLLILLTTPSALHLKNLLPILEALNNLKARYTVLTTNATAHTAVINAGFKPIDLASVQISKSDVNLIASSLEAFLTAFQSWAFLNKNTASSNFGDNTPNYVMRSLLKKSFYRYLFNYGLNVARLNKALHQNKPHVLYKIPNGFSTMDAAHRVLSDQIGITSATSLSAPILLRHRQWGIAPSDYILVAGEYQIEPLTGGGYLEKQIKVVGQPELDAPMNEWSQAASRAYIKNVLPEIDDNQSIITVVSSGISPESEELWFHRLIALTEQFPSLAVIFKLHPRLGVETFSHFKNEHKSGRFFFTNDANVYPYLAAADLVCTDLSQAARFAVCFNKPILSINLTGEAFLHNRLDDHGVADLVESLDALSHKIHYYLIAKNSDDHLQKNRTAFIKKYFTAADGQSAQRVADFLLSKPEKIPFRQKRTKPLWWLNPNA